MPHMIAEHGGFRLSPERNTLVHPRWRSPGGWYEEDCGWAIIAITFPELFTAQERRHAERTIKDIWPDEWEAIFCVALGPGESVKKDRRRFHESHASDWIVTAAITSSHHPGTAYEQVVGERWKPFERAADPSAPTLDRKAAEVQMAAFG